MQIEPTYEQTVEAVHNAASRHADIVQASAVGRSAEGRDIWLATITNPAIDNQLKDVLLVTGGTHGSEETGRAATMALLDWLCSPEGRPNLDRLVVLLCPCANPDATVRNSYTKPDGINLYQAFPFRAQPTCPEAAALYHATSDWIPHCAVDVHGLAGGAMRESIYILPGLPAGMHRRIGYHLTELLSAEAEAAGFPQRGGFISGEFRNPRGNLASKFVSEDNSLGYTVEMTENYYPLHYAVRSGMARLKRLVTMANQRWYWHPYPGYPCDIISGHGMMMFMAHGRTPGQRRRNRRRLVWAIEHGLSRVERLSPDRNGQARIELSTQPDTDPADLPDRYALQLRLIPSARLQAVLLENHELPPDEDHGWQCWQDDRSVLVRINIHRPLQPGTTTIAVRYEAPFAF
ncbi:MAG: M14 family zinc carboxypeptidase [Phycisphaerae bacterium]